MNSAFALFLITCITFSCGNSTENSHKNDIIQLLDLRRKGLEENNPPSYLSAISPNYNDGIDTYDTLKSKVETFLSQYSQIKLDIEKRTIFINKNNATVVEEYRLTGLLPSGKKLLVRRQGVLRLNYKEPQGWKIVNGINDFSSSAAYGG